MRELSDDRSTRDREAMRAEFASLAARVELLEDANPSIRTVAANAACGEAMAPGKPASRLAEQPSWWQCNRDWLVPAAVAVVAVVSTVVMVDASAERRRRAAATRVLENRARQAEANYLRLHGAFLAQQRVLDAELVRPHFATYDQRQFPTINNHEHRHEHTMTEHHSVADPSAIAAEVASRLPSAARIAEGVARRLPAPQQTTIIQPTRHTHDRTHTRERIHTRERVTTVKQVTKVVPAPARKHRAVRRDALVTVPDIAPSKTMADAIARRQA